MENFCKHCGNELKENALFCTGCGAKVIVEQASEPQNHKPMNSTSQRYNAAQKNRNLLLITIFSIVGVIIIGITVYFMINPYKASKNNVAQTVSTSTKKSSSSKPTPSTNNEATTISEYTEKLNALQIHNADQVLTVGAWKIEDKNGTLFLDANSIPSKDLTSIFDLYNKGNLASLQNWAKDVYYIAEDLSRKLNKEWIIDVSDHCVEVYPTALSAADLAHYSGSCGYSVPVLTGDKKADLSLIINSSVFGPLNNNLATGTTSGDYILPESGINRLSDSEIDALTLEQLRLARNEIYARHGYIFKSEDLKAYFSQKAWYHPDASYDGTTLSEVEKYNVEMIKNRERSFQ